MLPKLFTAELLQKHQRKFTNDWKDQMKHYLQKIMIVSQHASIADGKHFGPNVYGQQFRSVVV